MSIWDDPDMKSSDNFAKLEVEGDTFEGTITALRTKQWDDGSKCPEITLVTPAGDDLTWSAGQIQAKRKLGELRPEVGDYLKVTYARQEKRAGGKTLKHLDIEVRRGNGKPAQTTPAAGPTVTPAAIDPAAWNALDGAARDAILAKMGMAPAGAGGNAEPPPF